MDVVFNSLAAAELQGEAQLGHVPIFKLAVWPTSWIIKQFFKPRRTAPAVAAPAVQGSAAGAPMPSSPFASAAAAGPSLR